MKKLVSVLMAGTMALSLAACGSGKDNANTFTFANELDIKNLDSSDADDGMSFNAMHAVIDGLMDVDKDGKVTYGIAKEHTVSEDGLTHTFVLRDAKWSNGDPVRAQDFVYAWQRILKKSGNYAYMMGSDGAHLVGADELMAKNEAGSELTQEDLDTLGAKAVDDQTLVVTLTSPVSYFEELMTFPCYFPQNEKFTEEQGQNYGKSADAILSNGSFVMESWEPGSKAVFTKNEDYWDADSVKLDKLVMNLVQEPTVAAQNFDSGNNDYAPIDSDLVDKYKDNDAFWNVKSGFLFYVMPNLQNADLQNQNLRKALSLAIDREDFAQNVLKDGSVEANGFVPEDLSKGPNGEDFREDAKDFTTYDANAAQEALNQALQELGKSEVTLRLLYGTDESPMDTMATYLQNAFTKLDGLNIEMVATTKQDRIYNKEANGDFDLACTRWGPDYGDPTTYLYLMKTGNNNNYGKWSNEQYDALLNQINTELDVQKRWDLMLQAEELAMNDYANIPVFQKGNTALLNPKVKDLVNQQVGTPFTFKYVYKEG